MNITIKTNTTISSKKLLSILTEIKDPAKKQLLIDILTGEYSEQEAQETQDTQEGADNAE